MIYSTMMIKVIKDLFIRGKFQEVLDHFTQLETQEESTPFLENEKVENTVYLYLALQVWNEFLSLGK